MQTITLKNTFSNCHEAISEINRLYSLFKAKYSRDSNVLLLLSATGTNRQNFVAILAKYDSMYEDEVKFFSENI